MDSVYQATESRSNQKRVNTLTGMLFAMIKSGHSSLHEVGNKYPDPIDLESRIKKVKRWLDSKYSDFNTFYMPCIYLLFNAVPSSCPLVIAIDGPEIGNGCTILMLSLIYRKRSLPICWLVRKGKKGHWSVDLHVQSLKRLKLLLITGHRVVLLGDGEFDGWPIQQYCKDNNWDYVLRTAKGTQIETQHGDVVPIGRLCPMEYHDQYFVEDVYFTKNRYGTINCLVWHSDIYDGPLFLVSSFDWGKEIMDYYKQRFGIETLFGDIKSRGFNIHKVRIKDPERLNNLLMVVCLAFLLVFAFGLSQDTKSYLAKFMRKDRIYELSIFQRGLRALHYLIDNQIDVTPKFSSNFFDFICVRL